MSVIAGGGSGGFSDFFEGLFGRRARAEHGAPRGPQPSRDSRAKLAVPLQAVHDGGSVRVNVNNKQLDVKVPKGVKPARRSASVRVSPRCSERSPRCSGWMT